MEVLDLFVEPVQEGFIACEFFHAAGRELLEHGDRVVTGLAPQRWVDGSEEVVCLLTPRPAQVHRQVAQCVKRFGEDREDVE